MSPITREEFLRGRKAHPIESQIGMFLMNQRGYAFSQDEIARGVGIVRGQNALEDLQGINLVRTALNILVRERRVVSKIVAGTQYFMIPTTPVR